MIEQLSKEQLVLSVSWSSESNNHELSTIQFVSLQSVRRELVMVDPWISTRSSVHDMNEVLRIVVSWMVEYLSIGSGDSVMM